MKGIKIMQKPKKHKVEFMLEKETPTITKTIYPNSNELMSDQACTLLCGEIVRIALDDLLVDISKIKNPSKRNIALYNKATAEMFFQSKLFKLMNLDFEYLLKIAKKIKKLEEQRKIQNKIQKHDILKKKGGIKNGTRTTKKNIPD